jgi:predicted DCC family thiol-disulfide oxidoreductase YuxK
MVVESLLNFEASFNGCFFILNEKNIFIDHPVILFDGVCNFCNASINFIIQHDKKKVFRFAPLQSQAGQKLLQHYHLPTENFGSFLLIEKGIVYQKSTAALKVYSKLSWFWKWTQLGWLAPKFFRDAVYDLIARNRYKWFGKKETCMVPSSDVRNRFLV